MVAFTSLSKNRTVTTLVKIRVKDISEELKLISKLVSLRFVAPSEKICLTSHGFFRGDERRRRDAGVQRRHVEVSGGGDGHSPGGAATLVRPIGHHVAFVHY